MQCGVRATFVRVQPAGVEVPHDDGLIAWDTLVLVRFTHDEVLDVGEWMMLALLREVTERIVLMKILGTFPVRLWYVVAGLLSCWGGPPGMRKEL